MAHITAEANAPTGIFYRYFRNKADAVLEALDHVVEEFRSKLPQAGDTSFAARQVAVHRNLIRLFSDSPGILGCYYSYDYGERAFAAFFHDRTLQFDREHAERAIAELRRDDIDVAEVLPVAHALTSMTDNFVYRMCTGRDDTREFDHSPAVDAAEVLGALRYRAFLFCDPSGETDPSGEDVRRRAGAKANLRTAAERLRTAQQPRSGDRAPKRTPKRADSLASYDAVLSATLRLLDRLPYDDVRISDIERESSVTRGSIYHYFEEKRDVVAELIRLRLGDLHEALRRQAQHVAEQSEVISDYELLKSMIAVFMNAYATHPGLLRALYQLEQRDDQVSDLFHAYRAIWSAYVAGLFLALIGEAGEPDQRRQVMAYALLAMVERVAYDLFVDPFLELWDTPPDAVQVTELLAALWLRMICLEDPPSSVLASFPVLGKLRNARASP